MKKVGKTSTYKLFQPLRHISVTSYKKSHSILLFLIHVFKSYFKLAHHSEHDKYSSYYHGLSICLGSQTEQNYIFNMTYHKHKNQEWLGSGYKMSATCSTGSFTICEWGMLNPRYLDNETKAEYDLIKYPLMGKSCGSFLSEDLLINLTLLGFNLVGCPTYLHTCTKKSQSHCIVSKAYSSHLA